MRVDARTHRAGHDALVPSPRPAAAAGCVYIGDSRNSSICLKFMPKGQPPVSKLALVAAPQRVLTRDQLLETSRVYDNEVYDRSIDVQVLRLRRKIEIDPSQPQFILTERGA